MSGALFQVNDLCYLANGPYSFSVHAHDIIGFSGASGVGKTQMLRALVESILYEGTILYNGNPPEFYTPSQWRQLVALVPAEAQWWRESVAEHFPHTVSADLVTTLIDELGFEPEILSWKIERLSTGERQRLALARALCLNPAVVLLDEPCSALDSQATTRVEKILDKYRSRPDTALIWVSHDSEQLKRMANCCFEVFPSKLKSLW